ncbi:MAG: hypothetical protein ABIL02_00465 [candidate division WOR-3 bacterium]
MSEIIFEKEKQQLVIRFKCCDKIEVKDAACTLKTLNDDEKMMEVSSDKCVHITIQSGKVKVYNDSIGMLNREKSRLRFLLFIKKEYKKSLHLAKKLLKILPKDAELAGLLSVIYVYSHKYTKASLTLEEFSDDFVETQPELLFAKAHLMKFSHNFIKAISLFKKALRMIDQKNIPNPIDYVFKIEVYKALFDCYCATNNLTGFCSLVEVITKKNVKTLDIDRTIIKNLRQTINAILFDRIRTLDDADSLESLASALEYDNCYAEAAIIREGIAKNWPST